MNQAVRSPDHPRHSPRGPRKSTPARMTVVGRSFDVDALAIAMTVAFAVVAMFGVPALLADDGPTTTKDDDGFVALFNGKDLAGWEGNLDLWTVRDGMIVGDSPGIAKNEFLATKKTYGDFELRLEFRMKDGIGNSGVQFRSKREPGTTAVIGYQADLGEKYWGCLYDEHRRNKVLVQAPAELDKVLRKNDWNSYLIRAEGDRVLMKINGLTTVDYREPDATIDRAGLIALQIHSGPAMRMEFKNLRLKELGK